MSDLLDQIQAAVGAAFEPIFDQLTLTRVTRTIGNDGQPTESTATFTGRGIIVQYSARYLTQGLALRTERNALITFTSLATTPIAGDVLTDLQGQKVTVLEVKTDPARAVWDVKAST